MKLLVFLAAFVSLSAFANCNDIVCQASVGSKRISMDLQICGGGTQPSVSLVDMLGNPVNLPNSNPAAILAGYWNDTAGLRLRFIDDAGVEAFKLELVNRTNGKSGVLSANLPGLKVRAVKVICPNP